MSDKQRFVAIYEAIVNVQIQSVLSILNEIKDPEIASLSSHVFLNKLPPKYKSVFCNKCVQFINENIYDQTYTDEHYIAIVKCAKPYYFISTYDYTIDSSNEYLTFFTKLRKDPKMLKQYYSYITNNQRLKPIVGLIAKMHMIEVLIFLLFDNNNCKMPIIFNLANSYINRKTGPKLIKYYNAIICYSIYNSVLAFKYPLNDMLIIADFFYNYSKSHFEQFCLIYMDSLNAELAATSPKLNIIDIYIKYVLYIIDASILNNIRSLVDRIPEINTDSYTELLLALSLYNSRIRFLKSRKFIPCAASDRCLICLEKNYGDNETMVRCVCDVVNGHISCVLTWLYQNKLCISCRRDNT